MKKIAITIQNFVQFYSLKNYIDTAKNVQIDLYVPIPINDMGFDGMFDDIFNYLKKEKYNVYRKVKKIKYDILLEPYPMDIYFKFNYKYRLKYKYCAISAKPRITYKPEDNIYYDAILCHSMYEQEILNCYSKTFLVGRICYCDFKNKTDSSKKKTLLYLPTYGDLNSINDLTEELIKLSDKYNIIVKEHHGTNYLNFENDNRQKLTNCFTQLYDSTHPLKDLLEKSDVVLTDNSGSIFESLYTKVPVCIFSKNIDSCSINDIDSFQLQLVKKGIIPFTDNVNELDNIIKSALSKNIKNKQYQLHDDLFPIPEKKLLTSFNDVIDYFLNADDDVILNRIKLHRVLVEEYDFIKNKIYSVENINNELLNQNANLQSLINDEKNNNNILKDKLSLLDQENIILNQQLDEYKKGKLYRLSTKLCSFKSKFRRKKQ